MSTKQARRIAIAPPEIFEGVIVSLEPSKNGNLLLTLDTGEQVVIPSLERKRQPGAPIIAEGYAYRIRWALGRCDVTALEDVPLPTVEELVAVGFIEEEAAQYVASLTTQS